MRKWLPVGLLVVAVLWLVATAHLPPQDASEKGAVPVREKLVVYSDMPPDIIQTLAEVYRNEQQVELTLVPLTGEQIITHLKSPGNTPAPDLVWASQATLQELARFDLLQPYTSEQTDLVAQQFKDENGLWTGTWYIPIVFVVTNDYYHSTSKPLHSWQDLTAHNDVRIAMTDFVAADLSAELLYSMVEQYGHAEAFRKLDFIHRHVVQYSKYLSTPVRVLAMQKSDVAIADASTAREFMVQGLPLTMIYPQDGTAYYLYGVGIPKSTPRAQEVGTLLNWVMEGHAFTPLHRKHYYFYYTGFPNSQVVDSENRDLQLWPLHKAYTPTGRKALLAAWLKEVRFAGKEVE